jgi:hypothetical protein
MTLPLRVHRNYGKYTQEIRVSIALSMTVQFTSSLYIAPVSECDRTMPLIITCASSCRPISSVEQLCRTTDLPGVLALAALLLEWISWPQAFLRGRAGVKLLRCSRPARNGARMLLSQHFNGYQTGEHEALSALGWGKRGINMNACPLMQRVPTNCLEDLTPSDWMSIHNARLIPQSSSSQLFTQVPISRSVLWAC